LMRPVAGASKTGTEQESRDVRRKAINSLFGGERAQIVGGKKPQTL
jgi:hypothetical protein